MARKLLKAVVVLIIVVNTTAFAVEERCSDYEAGSKNVYWGDLHVHTAYSLDAWAYGPVRSPAEAYAYARGAAIEMPIVGKVTLDRPLDFMAVTDHADWFNLMYVCTDPEWSEDPYCDILTEKNSAETGGQVFAEYVLPTVTKAVPQPTPLCEKNEAHCATTRITQWQRIQKQTNQANAPCEFTAFNGYEWTATPDYSHTHRNVIFANENVTRDAIDYMNYPQVESLWEQLAEQCTEQDNCDVIAIPHNSNMGDGKSFEVEAVSQQARKLRARYERLVEIHQEKGNSECLPAFGSSDEDCAFEIRLTKNSQEAPAADFSEREWETMRRGYVRGLLLSGLAAFERSGRQENPLQLGVIASTDNHAATGGFVEENQWLGSVFGIGNFDRMMTRITFNPGGLVAVWAEENTRESIFAALKRREVFGTSGPRMQVGLDVSIKQPAISCEAGHEDAEAIPMGGEFVKTDTLPTFRVRAQYDRTPLQTIEIIKGELKDGQPRETVLPIWNEDKLSVCVTWQDADFDAAAPAFWYARVKEVSTPRWSAVHCKKAGRCDGDPNVEKTIQERAWSSPIWYLPELP